jgi:hypothetical protein
MGIELTWPVDVCMVDLGQLTLELNIFFNGNELRDCRKSSAMQRTCGLCNFLKSFVELRIQ